MKAVKLLRSAVLSAVLVIAMILGLGLTSAASSVTAEETEHITFSVTVDDVSSKSISVPYGGQLVVKYTVSENTGIDALQFTLSYDATAFTLVSVATDDTTALGTASKGTDEYLANIAFDNVKTEGDGAVYTATGDTLITACFTVNQNATLATAYTFGLVDINNVNGGYSTAWRVQGNGEAPSTHAPVAIGYSAPTVYLKGDLQFTLEDNGKVYDGVAAQDGGISVVSECEHMPTIDRVWFVQNGDGETYTKLDSNPVNVGTYYVVAEFAQTDYWNAYCGYTETGVAGVYTLTSEQGKVAVYTITQRAVSIAFAYRSEQYKLFDNGNFADYLEEQGYLTVSNLVSNETVEVTLNATNILNANVGNYGYAVSGDNVILVGLTDSPNYAIGTISGTFEIIPKEIVIGTDATFTDGSFKYDGTEKTISVSIDADYVSVLSVVYNGGESGCSKNGAINVLYNNDHEVIGYTITATFSLESQNYAFKDDINSLTATLTITESALTQAQVDELVHDYVVFYAVDNATANTFVYAVDGAENPLKIVNRAGWYAKTYDKNSAYIGVIVNTENQSKLSANVLYKDGAELATEKAATALNNFAGYAKTNAGDYVVIITVQPATGYAFASGVTGAYTITLKINRAALTITATSEVQYGEDEIVTVDNGADAWISGENYATYSTTANALKSYVLSTYHNTMTAGTPYALSWAEGAEAAIEEILFNYDVNLAVAANLEVAKKIIDAADYDFTGYQGVYDGTNHTLTVVGANSVINYTIANAATVRNVADSGTYTATIELADADNYTFANGDNDGWTVDGDSATKSATVSITAVGLVINAAYTRTTATFTISGFVGGETEAVLTDLAYLADGASTNVSANVYTINGYVANAITVSATSSNTNYTIANATLKNVRKVEYVAGSYDVAKSGEEPVLPATDLLFDGFTTEQPAAVALNHYTFVRFATNADNTAAFDFAQAINGNKQVYAIWQINNQFTLTLVYMIEGDATNLINVEETLYYSDDVIRYNAELPVLAAKKWFKVQEWFTDSALTAEFVGGITLVQDTTLYANYKFNIGLGDVNGDGFVNANDITLYRQWIVGGYEMEEVAPNTEWAKVNANDFDAENVYFIKRVADSNALTALSTTLGDNHLDIRDVSTIRMALVGGYGFSVLEGKFVDGEEIIVTRTVSTDNASDLLILAKSGLSIQLAQDITEEMFVGTLTNCEKDVVIDLNGHTLTLKSLSIALANDNTGKIELKNGTIYVADGNGVSLTAPNGSVILDNVTLYDKNGSFTIQAADHSLHFLRAVAFLKDDNGSEVPATVKVEKDTRVVVETTAALSVAKLVVTENFEITENQDAEIALVVRGEHEAIVIEGNFRNEITTLAELIAAAGKGGEYALAADIAYSGTLPLAHDFTLDLNGHTLRSVNNTALAAISGATLIINGNGGIMALEACVMAYDGSEIIINGGTYTSIDNFVIGTNGTSGCGANVITVNGGTFNGGITTAGYVACGVYVANNDTVVLNGGTFNITNGVGVLARSGSTTVGAGVVFNVSGNGTLGKVGDSLVTVPSGKVIVWDMIANYPGGQPTVVNNSTYGVFALVESEADIAAVNAIATEIKLCKDITVNNDIEFTTAVIFNLNGHNVAFNGGAGFAVYEGGKLTMNGEGNVSTREVCLYATNGGVITVNGGTYTSTDNFVIGTNGSAGRQSSSITVNGGTFNGGITTAGYIACGVYAANNDTVVLNGGTFNITNGVGVLARSGNTTVGAGVVFNVSGGETSGKVGDSVIAVPTGKVIVLDKAANYPGGQPTVVNNSEYEAFAIVNVNNVATVVPVISTYEQLNAANGHVVLGADIDCGTHDIVYASDVTIDLNGYDITFDGWGFEVRNGATLTINGNGNISAVEACLYAQYAGNVVVNGGTYTSTNNFVIGTNGSSNRGGNTITVN
nr:hypothetical protein [Clostridia bacterium]